MKTTIVVLAVIATSLLIGNIAIPVAPQQNQANSPQRQETADQDQEQDQELQKIKQVVRREFMRGKLVANQQIVEGLSVSDFDLIGEGADGVTALVKGEHWFVVDTPQYKQLSDDMQVASRRLKQAAVKQNIEAAALRYFELTLKCIDCHQYYMNEF